MLDVRYSAQFRKDYKLMKKRGLPLDLLHDIVERLRSGLPLPERCRDHALIGDYDGFRECHIRRLEPEPTPLCRRSECSLNYPLTINDYNVSVKCG